MGLGYRVVAVVAVFAIQLWIWTGSARAATATLSGDEVIYDAALGETNDLTVTVAGANLTFHDASAPVAAGSGCVAVDPNTVTCPLPTGQLSVMLEDRADLFTNVGNVGVPTLVDGGTGADVLTGDVGRQILFGGRGSDTIRGGLGNDRLEAGDLGLAIDSPGAQNILEGGLGSDYLTCDCVGGHNVLNGGSGDDRLVNGWWDGNASPDRYVGGDGNDTVVYMVPFTSDMDAPDARPRFISLDGVANDGRAGEKDNVEPDVEGVVGTWGPDVIIASSARNTLFGFRGNDVIRGGAGHDRIRSGGGADTVWGGRGGDVVSGGIGNDWLSGDRGADALYGESGTDTCNGGAGVDTTSGCEN
jgi:Ca2+-binding RTX toxin-like protein